MSEKLEDLTFPMLGVDVSTEIERQRAGTTPVGTNVRGLDPFQRRARGGSRPGLSRYIDEALPSYIQHLNLIVDPTTAALISDEDEGDLDDPSTSVHKRRMPLGQQRRLRAGGSGRQPNIKRPRPHLTITANNQTKNQGSTFTFLGTEFSTLGLTGADAVTKVTLTSTGAASSAAVGAYPIVAAKAIGTGLNHYRIAYVNGTLTVNSAGAGVVTVTNVWESYAQTVHSGSIEGRVDSGGNEVSVYTNGVLTSYTPYAETLTATNHLGDSGDYLINTGTGDSFSPANQLIGNGYIIAGGRTLVDTIYS